ncbi:hypothetical protein JCM8097_000254 [Rhodosporidiobolus ruineniae]
MRGSQIAGWTAEVDGRPPPPPSSLLTSTVPASALVLRHDSTSYLIANPPTYDLAVEEAAKLFPTLVGRLFLEREYPGAGWVRLTQSGWTVGTAMAERGFDAKDDEPIVLRVGEDLGESAQVRKRQRVDEPVGKWQCSCEHPDQLPFYGARASSEELPSSEPIELHTLHIEQRTEFPGPWSLTVKVKPHTDLAKLIDAVRQRYEQQFAVSATVRLYVDGHVRLCPGQTPSELAFEEEEYIAVEVDEQ